MTKHVADRNDGESPHRAQRYAEIERQSGAEGSHPAAQALHRRPKDRNDASRVTEYTRIERGEEA